MFLKPQLIYEVNQYLSMIYAYVELQNRNGLFDINKYCEDVFCGLLNKVYDLNLFNLNKVQYNFPAVDLGDYNKKICFQVTSTNEINKIRYTVEKFSENELFKDFNELYIFILGSKKNYKVNINAGENFNFAMSKNIIDLSDLSITINNLDDNKIIDILYYFKSIVLLHPINHNRDIELFERFNTAIRNHIQYLLNPEYDFAFTPTPEKLIDEYQNIINEWSMADRIFTIESLEVNKQIIISSLSNIREYMFSPLYFQEHSVEGFIMPIKDPERKLFNEMKDNTYECGINTINAYKEMCEIYNKIIV